MLGMTHGPIEALELADECLLVQEAQHISTDLQRWPGSLREVTANRINARNERRVR
ncbi:hypothetical protein M378DRAFT_19552 [Amanita muscaria Koide BX008]|uniref:Uncharacterized protein n=1 Tax=Amanita muscaria (strain Koide BX008) TaxID=946122 RepID=A0A0C2RU80_AMAMK|nr:hypothetical protein M378DRAFT_19552 [Amanita muscaria Koide BX008]